MQVVELYTHAVNWSHVEFADMTRVLQDFGRGTYRKEPTFEVDDEIIAASRRMSYV